MGADEIDPSRSHAPFVGVRQLASQLEHPVCGGTGLVSLASSVSASAGGTLIARIPAPGGWASVVETLDPNVHLSRGKARRAGQTLPTVLGSAQPKVI